MTLEFRPGIKPFLKWAGGKRWLVHDYPGIFPKSYNRYFEPFLGSGAVFFGLRPDQAHLSDLNQELVEAYCAIRDNWRLVWKYLLWHRRKHGKEHYYRTRLSQPRSPAARAARLVYLNRTCFNGLYRVNLKGFFNVPKGTRDSVILPDDNFGAIAEVLRSISIVCRDFEGSILGASVGDFIYADPPYTVQHNQNNFIKYNERLFCWDDQTRLANALLVASKRGALVLVCNANSPSIERLYSRADWNHIVLHRQSLLASAASKRQFTTELAITNYDFHADAPVQKSWRGDTPFSAPRNWDSYNLP